MESTPTPIIDITDLALLSPGMSGHWYTHRLTVSHGDVAAVLTDSPSDGRHLLRMLATLEQPERGEYREELLKAITVREMGKAPAVMLFRADIGKVKRISLGEDNVNVQLAILAKYASRIRQDAVAVVDSPTLIGSEYISIVPGAPNAPKIPAGGMIPSIEKKSISDCCRLPTELVRDRGPWDLWWLPENWLTGCYQTWKK